VPIESGERTLDGPHGALHARLDGLFDRFRQPFGAPLDFALTFLVALAIP
jgi:hypothetical protein